MTNKWKKGKIMMFNKKLFLFLILLAMMTTLIGLDGLLYAQAVSDSSDEPEAWDIYFGNKKIRGEDGYVINNGVYLPCDVIGKYIKNSAVTVDEANNKIILDVSQLNIQLGDQEVLDFIEENMQEAYIPLKNIRDELYFPLDVLKSFFHVSYELSGDNIYIEDVEGLKTMGEITTDNAQVKPSVSDDQSIDLQFKKGDIVEFIKETDHYYKVLTMNGISCFVYKNDISLFNIDLSQVDLYSFKKQKDIEYSKKINLVWEYVYKNTPAPDDEKNEAIDIISPTWFYFNDTEGNLGNKADKGYLNQVKANGYQVWGLVTNSFNGDLTNKILNDDALSKKVAAQLMFYASLYDLDGLNIDFENVKDEDRQALTNFIALLRQYTEKQGLYLSIDVMIPASWTVEYDRAALSELVDYIAVMTYDEHWSSSTVAGSVASYGWVKNAVKNTLKDVPSEKLLLGIPLYTRLWIEANEQVSSQSLSMDQVRQLVEDKRLKTEWLDEEKQYYIEYEEDNKSYKVWIEDSRSLAHKLGLVEKYNLGGSASWRKGFEEDQVWKIFQDIVKNNQSYTLYANENY